MAVVPRPRLLGLLLIGACIVALSSVAAGLLAIAALYLVAVAAGVGLDLRLAPKRAFLEARRRHDDRLSLGEANAVDVEVAWIGPRTGQWSGSTRLWVRDETPSGTPVDRRFLDGSITPGGRWAGRYHLSPVRRGEAAFGAINLRVETPFKLLALQYAFPTSDAARVYPNLRAVRRYELLARRGRSDELGPRSGRAPGRGTEYERLRDYLPDDDYRRIAWKATARRYQPVTVEYETERSQVLMLVLDTGRLMRSPLGAMEKLDYAVNAALMLAYVAIRRDDRVGLLTYGDRIDLFVPPNRGRRQFHLLLESLYRVRAQPVEPVAGKALAYVATRQSRRSLLVLLTDVAEATEADDLATHLSFLARRHLPLCVTMSDPDVVRLAEQTPSDSRRAYEKVVAQRMLDERRAFLNSLEQRGVLSLDVAADRLTAEVVNRYLEIKARTLL
ncbi:MAG: DUF58 domain-containing protein [Chloroflexota bacterium]